MSDDYNDRAEATEPSDHPRFYEETSRGMGIKNPDVRDAGPVSIAIKSINEAIDRLDHNVDHLYSAITPILNPNERGVSDAPTDTPEKIPMSGLTETLATIERRINNLAHAITRIDRRVEL